MQEIMHELMIIRVLLTSSDKATERPFQHYLNSASKVIKYFKVKIYLKKSTEMENLTDYIMI